MTPLHEMPGGPYARVVLDSISEAGDRVTTMEVKFHRIVAEELLTHRVFSRNAASSRAIPAAKIIERVDRDPAVPLYWGANQPGMQARAELEGYARLDAIEYWHLARSDAINCARRLDGLGLHKQLVNRLLHPFQWHVMIITAIDWDGFWAQRCHEDAQPEMRALADVMREAHKVSMPQELGQGQWHAPFLTSNERHQLREIELSGDIGVRDIERVKLDGSQPCWRLLRWSVARCARVSYLSHDGTSGEEADERLFHRLYTATPQHASPFEHICTPAKPDAPRHHWSGNLWRWHQLRHLVGMA